MNDACYIFHPSCPPLIGWKILDFCVRQRTTRTIIIVRRQGRQLLLAAGAGVDSPSLGLFTYNFLRAHLTDPAKHFTACLLQAKHHRQHFVLAGCPRQLIGGIFRASNSRVCLTSRLASSSHVWPLMGACTQKTSPWPFFGIGILGNRTQTWPNLRCAVRPSILALLGQEARRLKRGHTRRDAWDMRRGTGVMLVKDPHTGTWPLAPASCFPWGMAVTTHT